MLTNIHNKNWKKFLKFKNIFVWSLFFYDGFIMSLEKYKSFLRDLSFLYSIKTKSSTLACRGFWYNACISLWLSWIWLWNHKYLSQIFFMSYLPPQEQVGNHYFLILEGTQLPFKCWCNFFKSVFPTLRINQGTWKVIPAHYSNIFCIFLTGHIQLGYQELPLYKNVHFQQERIFMKVVLTSPKLTIKNLNCQSKINVKW